MEYLVASSWVPEMTQSWEGQTSYKNSDYPETAMLWGSQASQMKGKHGERDKCLTSLLTAPTILISAEAEENYIGWKFEPR